MTCGRDFSTRKKKKTRRAGGFPSPIRERWSCFLLFLLIFFFLLVFISTARGWKVSKAFGFAG